MDGSTVKNLFFVNTDFGADDTGVDVTFYGATSGRYMMWDESSDRLELTDNVKINFGNENDLSIFHTGSHSNIEADGTGDLKITQKTADQDIIFRCDDGSGGETDYLTLDGSAGHTVANKEIQFLDSVFARFGTGNDMAIYSDGTDSYFQQSSGNMYFYQAADDKDIVFQSDNGSGGVETYFYLDGSVGMTVFPDAKKLAFGSSFDLKIEHDGSNSYLSHEGTGNLIIRNTTDDADIIFQSDDGSGGLETYFYLDGSLSSGNPFTVFPDNARLALGSSTDMYMYHNGTDTTINNDTGDLYIKNSADDKDIIFQCDDGSGSTETYFKLDGSVSSGNPWTVFPDQSRLGFGAGLDLRFYHDGTNSYVENKGGNLYIRNDADDKDIIFQSDDGSGGVTAYLTLNGSAGYTTVQKNMLFDDNTTLGIGASNDLQLYHNGSHSLISNQNGNLYLRNQTNDGDIIIQADNGSGGDATYMTFDGGIASILTYRDILMANDGNDGKIKFGASQDLSIYHDGSNSYIDQTGTGNLYIRNTQEDGLIYMQSNYNGSVSSFFYLHGAYSSNNPYTIFPDNSIAAFGNAADLRIKHDGSNSYIQQSGTGDLYFQQYNDDRDIVFQNDDGSGGLTEYLRIDGGSEEVIFSKPIVTAETQIKVLPHQFMSNEDGGANKSAQFRDDTIIGVRTSADDAELYAFVEIPYGKTATNVTVYGNDTNLAVNVYESDINAGALTDKTPEAGCRVGAVCDITDVAYSTTNYLAIKVTTTSYTNDIVYGAVVTIT